MEITKAAGAPLPLYHRADNYVLDNGGCSIDGVGMRLGMAFLQLVRSVHENLTGWARTGKLNSILEYHLEKGSS